MEDLNFKKQLEWLIEQTELSGEDCWDIVCALRGPDMVGSGYTNASTLIKTSTTQVIRDWLIFQVAETSGDKKSRGIIREWVLTNRGQFTFSEVSKQCGFHFANHIYEAEEAIQRVDSEFYIFKKENDDEGSTD